MTIHVGLIGGGNISATHARAANAIPGVSVAAIYCTNEAKVAWLSQEHGAKPYTDFDATVSGTATDGSLTNPNSTIFTTAAAGASEPVAGCNISLH